MVSFLIYKNIRVIIASVFFLLLVSVMLTSLFADKTRTRYADQIENSINLYNKSLGLEIISLPNNRIEVISRTPINLKIFEKVFLPNFQLIDDGCVKKYRFNEKSIFIKDFTVTIMKKEADNNQYKVEIIYKIQDSNIESYLIAKLFQIAIILVVIDCFYRVIKMK